MIYVEFMAFITATVVREERFLSIGQARKWESCFIKARSASSWGTGGRECVCNDQGRQGMVHGHRASTDVGSERGRGSVELLSDVRGGRMHLCHCSEPLLTARMNAFINGLDLMEPSIELNDVCKGLVVVRVAILTTQFGRHECDNVSIEGEVGDMQRMISQTSETQVLKLQVLWKSMTWKTMSSSQSRDSYVVLKQVMKSENERVGRSGEDSTHVKIEESLKL